MNGGLLERRAVRRDRLVGRRIHPCGFFAGLLKLERGRQVGSSLGTLGRPCSEACFYHFSTFSFLIVCFKELKWGGERDVFVPGQWVCSYLRLQTVLPRGLELIAPSSQHLGTYTQPPLTVSPFLPRAGPDPCEHVPDCGNQPRPG